MDTARITEEFPAPSFRGAQERALADVRAAFEAGNDVVLVRAPTGSGKSLLARAIAGGARRPGEAEPHEAVGAYYGKDGQAGTPDDLSHRARRPWQTQGR